MHTFIHIQRYVHIYTLLSLVQLCEEMFKRIEANTDPELTMAVEVTYLMHHLKMEMYNL